MLEEALRICQEAYRPRQIRPENRLEIQGDTSDSRDTSDAPEVFSELPKTLEATRGHLVLEKRC